MTGDADDELFGQLTDAVSDLDAVPAEVTLAARSALAWRNIDARLAEILHDSALEEAVALRSSSGLRALTFETADGDMLELEVNQVGDTREITGQVIPPVVTRIEIRHPGGTRETHSDELGQFRTGGILPGPVSLRWQPPSGPAVHTGWVVL